MTNINNIRRNSVRFALVPASALALTLAAAGCSQRSANRVDSPDANSARYSQSTSYDGEEGYRSSRVAGDVAQRRRATSVAHDNSPEEDLAAARPGITGSASAVEGQWSQTRSGIETVPHAGMMDDDVHGMTRPNRPRDTGEFSARRTDQALSGEPMYSSSATYSYPSTVVSPSRPSSMPISSGATPEEDLAGTPAGYATTNEPSVEEVWEETEPGFERVPDAGNLDGSAPANATYEF